jgi:hypothetical protein
MDNITEAIKNLEAVSCVLEKFANNNNFYNTDYGFYLENMSWEMSKHANELREINYSYGDIL